MRYYNNTNAETYKKSARLSLFVFLCNCPNFFLILYSAFISSTAVVWVDLLVSFGETLHSLIVWLVAAKMVKETGDRYNFGMGRLEVFVSFVCDMIISVGMVGVVIGAVLNILSPEAPSSALLLFCVLKVSNSIYDVVFLVKQVKICRLHPSKLNETERIAYRDALINDITVGVIALICYLFRSFAFVMYFSPIATLILAVYFIVGYVKHIKSSIEEISDVSLSIKRQDEIYDIVMSERDIIKRITSVNCRRLNGTAYIEVSLVMRDDATYAEMQSYLSIVREEIAKIEPNAEVVLVVGSNT